VTPEDPEPGDPVSTDAQALVEGSPEEAAEQAQVNGCTALRFLDDMGHTHTIFRHPIREDAWLAAVHLGDEDESNIFEAMISTIALSQ
jgi:hypothetical protein